VPILGTKHPGWLEVNAADIQIKLPEQEIAAPR
jgi:hypothetical protein